MKQIKNIIILSLVIIVIGITFFNKYTSLLNNIKDTVKSEEAEINRYIDLSQGFIDLLTIHGNNYLEHPPAADEELYSFLNYDQNTDSYNLESISGTKYQSNAGSITGLGDIPDSGATREELNLAIEYNKHFQSVYANLPEVAWVYYTSNNNFISMYPWISSKDFSFSTALKEEVFFKVANSENDPLREAVWTPVYMDHAGKGLMVTLSSPIYKNDNFMGVVSIDFTNDMLSEIITSPYEIYIIDDTDSVIANSKGLTFYDEVPKINSLLNCSQSEIDEMKAIDNNKIELLDGRYIYSIDFKNAPWKMYLRVSVWSILEKSLVATLPIIIICLFLLFTYFEVEKRKKAEEQLKKSFSELKSYQSLLENAAKYDFLTSTVNRRGLMDIFNNDISITKIPIMLIMGDIDHFKIFNDTYGHTAGDKVLVEIASIMQKCVKTDDVVCRWGGEEFVIMLLDSTFDEAVNIAESMRKGIEDMIIPWDNSVVLKATMTFGVYEYDYNNDFGVNVSKVDSVLYAGKEKGRNMVMDSRDCE